MPRYQFERESRTPHSEAFIILEGDNEVGRVDVHFGSDVAHATLCIPEDSSEDDIQDLIGEVDERLVMPAAPFREDFVVTVWLGRQAGVYSEDLEEAIDEEPDEVVEGDGRQG